MLTKRNSHHIIMTMRLTDLIDLGGWVTYMKRSKGM